MLVLFAVIFGGILTGRLSIDRRLAFLPSLITGIIWVLLFLLGVEIGSDPAVVRGATSLGVTAFVIFACSAAGSIGAAWLLWRGIRGRTARGVDAAGSVPAAGPASVSGPASAVPAQAAAPGPTESASLWRQLRGSLVIVAFFAAGCAVGLLLPPAGTGTVSTCVLYALMFCVGITLGHDSTLAERVRQLDPRLALLPAATAAGTLAGAVLAAPLIAPWSVTDSLAVGAGFGYYSLSSIFIAGFRGPELATIALLCNVMREIFTLLCAPLVARWAGPLAAVSIGGATTFDTTLPIITRAAGRPYAVVAIFHGCVLDFSVPFLVTLFCSL